MCPQPSRVLAICYSTMKNRSVLVVDPTSGDVVVNSQQECDEQAPDVPKGFVDNCLATPILLAIQGVSRTERQNLLNDNKDGHSNPSSSDAAALQRGQYLCTGYDMYCFYEPNVFEAMSCLHSRLRRLIYCSKADPVNAVLQRGCSKFYIHDLPGTNHRYRVFEYHSKTTT